MSNEKVIDGREAEQADRSKYDKAPEEYLHHDIDSESSPC
jgi:hypothetical protein